MEHLIELRDVYKIYQMGDEAVHALDGISMTVDRGEFVLLCTDGLVETVSDQEMFYEVQHAEDLNYCLQRLLELSKRSGAPDNVTAVLLQQL